MRHIIIGDVHGCIYELKALVEKLQLRQDDAFYFIGDLIDRGPDSAGVVKFVKNLSRQYSMILILGNHEEKLLRYLHHKQFNPSAIKYMKGTEKFNELIQQLDDSEIQLLSSSYLNYNILSENICLLHGGIPGSNKIDLSINHKYSHDLFKSEKGFELILKTRYLDELGNFISLGQENEKSIFWAEHYDGKYGKVIFGHHATISEMPAEFNQAINIDTGCVFGGFLSACILEGGKMYFVTSPAQKVYIQKK